MFAFSDEVSAAGPASRLASLPLALRWAARALWRRPALSVTAVAVLAIVVVASAMLLAAWQATRAPLAAFAEPERLVVVHLDNPTAGTAGWPFGAERFFETRREARTVSGMGATRGARFDLSAPGEPERLTGARATPELFAVLGIRPVTGRVFGTDPADEATVVISERLFSRRFSGDPRVLGQSLVLDGRSYRLIGVLPAAMSVPAADTDAWIPLVLTEGERLRALFHLRVVARLAPGATVEQVRAELDTIGTAIAARFPDTDSGYQVRLVPLGRELFGSLDAPLRLLAVLAGLLTVLAAVNLAGLLAARATLRAGDDALAVALGAGPGFPRRQSLLEAALLAAGGLVAGLTVTWAMLPATAELLLRANPRVAGITLEPTTFLATAVAVLVVALAAAWLTGRAVARRASPAVLRAGGRTASTSRGAARALATLVAVEVALGTALLVPGLRLVAALEALLAVDPGFAAEGSVTFEVNGPNPGSPTAADPTAHFATLAARIDALPGVSSVGAMHRRPLTSPQAASTQFSFDDQPVEPGKAPAADYRVASPGLFDALGVRRVMGRDFAPTDTADGELVVIVNEAFVRRHVPSGDPLGRRIDLASKLRAYRRIVGVVADVRLGSLEQPVEPAVFVPWTQNHVPTALRSMFFVVRTDGAVGELGRRLAEVVRGLDPTQAISVPQPLSTYVDAAVAPRRDQARVVTGLAALAILLAACGIYGQAAYVLSSRRPELGLRVALGATAPRLLARLVLDGLCLAGIGALAGVGLATATEPLLAQLTALAPAGPWIQLGAPLLLLVVATAAFALPALTATRAAASAARSLARAA